MQKSIIDKNLFETIIDIIGESVYVVDTDYKVIYLNKKVREMIFGGKDVRGYSIFDILPNLTKENSTIAKVFESGEPIKEHINRYIDIEGKRRISIANTYPIKKNNKIIGAFEYGEDITGISNLTEQLTNKKEKELYSTKTNHNKDQLHTSYYTLDSIIGESPAIKRLKEQIEICARSTSNLFIYGETGTGKELVAQAIYSLTNANTNVPFVAYNCAAIPESLMESILFGTVKGSFTGAENKPGLFELANGGIMFLDEINSMPLDLQAKILRVIEEGKVRRVGGQNEIPVNFRLISTTNVAPEKILENEKMRRDLFYRINVLSIDIPPLRDRKEDIHVLVNKFIHVLNSKLKKDIIGIHQDALNQLIAYHWPGNIRELKNTIDRAMNFAKGKIIQKEDIKLISNYIIETDSTLFPSKEGRIKLKEALSEMEVTIIKRALRESVGNVAKAARDLDIPQQTLNSKLDKFNLRDYKNRI